MKMKNPSSNCQFSKANLLQVVQLTSTTDVMAQQVLKSNCFPPKTTNPHSPPAQ